MKKINLIVLALSIACVQDTFSADTLQPASSTAGKPQLSELKLAPANKGSNLKNLKAIFTSAVAVSSGIKAGLLSWDGIKAARENPLGNAELCWSYFSAALLYAFVSMKAFESTTETLK